MLHNKINFSGIFTELINKYDKNATISLQIWDIVKS